MSRCHKNNNSWVDHELLRLPGLLLGRGLIEPALHPAVAPSRKVALCLGEGGPAVHDDVVEVPIRLLCYLLRVCGL